MQLTILVFHKRSDLTIFGERTLVTFRPKLEVQSFVHLVNRFCLKVEHISIPKIANTVTITTCNEYLSWTQWYHYWLLSRRNLADCENLPCGLLTADHCSSINHLNAIHTAITVLSAKDTKRLTCNTAAMPVSCYIVLRSLWPSVRPNTVHIHTRLISTSG